MNNSTLHTLLLPTILLLSACGDKAQPPATSTASNTSAASTPMTTDTWLGKWNGPEGTFLEISGGNGRYEIIIQDLDGPKHYPGMSNGDGITFERNGSRETIQASNGADTGMKWLANKSNCLRTRMGEGWCRD